VVWFLTRLLAHSPTFFKHFASSLGVGADCGRDTNTSGRWKSGPDPEGWGGEAVRDMRKLLSSVCKGDLTYRVAPKGRSSCEPLWPSLRGLGAKTTAWAWLIALGQILPTLGSDDDMNELGAASGEKRVESLSLPPT